MVLALQLLAALVALDMVLGWLQPDPTELPRRLTHALTEPLERPLRKALVVFDTAGWDLSPLVLIAILGMIRVWLIQP